MMASPPREKHRDDRDYDATALSARSHGAAITRDYSAHFFRWSFARRMIKRKDRVLDIGCGTDLSLAKILFSSAPNRLCRSYTGVDLNPLPACKNQNVILHERFNLVGQWRELEGNYDVIVHLEVLEHMHPRHGVAFLRACRELLAPGGTMLMSTPRYDGIHHAANHIHEYTTNELQKLLTRTGWVVAARYGTFMNIKHLKGPLYGLTPVEQTAVRVLAKRLGGYLDNDALSCFFAPILPDLSRNNLWVCTK